MEGNAFATMSEEDIREITGMTRVSSDLEDLTVSEFREKLSEFIDPVSQKTFFNTVIKTFELGSRIVQEEEGHGMTYVVANEGKTPVLDRYRHNSKPFNGTGHNVFDTNAYQLMRERRERDLAGLVGYDGELLASNFHLPDDPLPFQEKYGIQGDISAFMGYTSIGDDYLGARKGSAWNASLMMTREVEGSEGEIEGEVMVLAFGEESGIEAFYCGHRISNRRGDVAWERAEKTPNVRRYCPSRTYLTDAAGREGNALRSFSQRYEGKCLESPCSYC